MCKSVVQVVILAHAKKHFSANGQVIYLSISVLLQGLMIRIFEVHKTKQTKTISKFH